MSQPEPIRAAEPATPRRVAPSGRATPLIEPVRPERPGKVTPKAKRSSAVGDRKAQPTAARTTSVKARQDASQRAHINDSRRWGVPGWQICLAGALAVLAAATWSAANNESLGPAAGITLIATTVIAAVVTRRGDLPLVAMYPPLAYTASAFLAGQLLVDPDHSWRTAQALMLVETLGNGAPWVVTATIVAALLVGLRTLIAAARDRQTSQASGAALAVNAAGHRAVKHSAVAG